MHTTILAAPPAVRTVRFLPDGLAQRVQDRRDAQRLGELVRLEQLITQTLGSIKV